MNPCPCGFFGDASRTCRCTPPQLLRYRGRLSGPLRDRLDMTVEVPALPPESLHDVGGGEPSAVVRERVIAARARQAERGAWWVPNQCGAHACVDREALSLDAGARRVLAAAVRRLALSARGYDRVRKVARTVADLEGADGIAAEHVAEALQFRVDSALP